MNALSRISGISFHLDDLDAAFPDLVRTLEELQVALLNHDEIHLVEQRIRLAGLLAIRIFRREEEAMEICRDRCAALHKSAHQKFLRGLAECRRRLSSEGHSVGLAQEARAQLVEWLVDHHRLLNAGLGQVVEECVRRSSARSAETAGLRKSDAA